MFSPYSSVRCLPNGQLLPSNSPSTRDLIFIQSTEYRVMWKWPLTDEPPFAEGLLWSVTVLGVHRLGITLLSSHCALSGLTLTPSDSLIHVGRGTQLCSPVYYQCTLACDMGLFPWWHHDREDQTEWCLTSLNSYHKTAVNLQNKYKDADTQRHGAFETSLHLGQKVRTERSRK